MPASEARIAASRANGAKSRGPNTDEGKATSRRNAYKHGMAGGGVVLPPVDSAEVERRARAMQGEMRPTTEMGRFLVNRLAELTVRVERSSRQERAATESRVLRASEAFDEARLAAIDHAASWIRAEPATHARTLRSMPEGIDRMVANLLALREELNTGLWDWSCGERVANLAGSRWGDVPVTRIQAVSQAIVGDFRHLRPGDGDGLSDLERVDWAREAMAGLIDQQIDALLAERETLDRESIEEDREGAPLRALFDPSKEAALARRYEAAAERGVFRTLDELRKVEGEAARHAQPEVPAEDLEEAGPDAPSGSFGAPPAARHDPAVATILRPEPGPPAAGPAPVADHIRLAPDSNGAFESR